MTTRLIIILVTIIFLQACRVAPAYRRPTIATPATFRGSAPTTAATDPASIADLKWFEIFQDEELQKFGYSDACIEAKCDTVDIPDWPKGQPESAK